jgi:putative FmdB family regulatory protein
VSSARFRRAIKEKIAKKRDRYSALANSSGGTHNRPVSDMPTYEYACQKCGHQFEQFQSMRDEPLKKCPQCKKAGLKRLVGGGAGLIFKGTGFYITDYKAKSGGKEGGDKKPAETKSTGSDSKSTPASATAAKSTSDSAKK